MDPTNTGLYILPPSFFLQLKEEMSYVVDPNLESWHQLISGVESPRHMKGRSGMGENMGFGRGPGDQGSDVLRQETHAFVKEKTLVLHRMDAHNIRVVAGVSGRSLVDVVYGVCPMCVRCD